MSELTPSQELDLFQRDRPAWLLVIAPRVAKRLRTMSSEEINRAWSIMSRDYQRAVWAALDDKTRESVRLARLPEVVTVPNCPMPETAFAPVVVPHPEDAAA